MKRLSANGTMNQSSLLLDIGVPYYQGASGLMVEAQALNGLRLWATHFGHVTVCAPLQPSSLEGISSIVWSDPSNLIAEGRISLEAFPWGYHPRDHFRYRDKVRRRLDTLVAAHRYLCFSNLGVFGSWGSVAVKSAQRQNRKYSLWFDWVLHEMPNGRLVTSKEKMRWAIFRRLIRRQTDDAVRKCSLGLFHGQTVYNAYAPQCRQPALVHDIHVKPSDAISDDDLNAKLGTLPLRTTIRIGYVGRVHPMKAPMQWIEAIAATIQTVGIGKVEATWLGDGPMLGQARERVAQLGLEKAITFVGFVADRSQVLAFLRSVDLFAFTHIAPESPRCLIEALISGVPLVGYESAYVRELVGGRGGAVLSPIGISSGLTENLVRIIGDRSQLAQLTNESATARSIYNDEAVFLHRSALIKEFA